MTRWVDGYCQPTIWSFHPSPSRCSGCREGHVDLVLLVDGSKSVRPQNFELVKRFVNQIVDFLDVSPEGTRVGLVQFSSRVRTEFPLGRYGTAAEVKQAVLAVEYMERGTMTGLALRHMVEHSFSEAQGARPRALNVPRVGLVFTDGRSQDDISVWAARAKEEGEPGAARSGLGLGCRGEEVFLRPGAPPCVSGSRRHCHVRRGRGKGGGGGAAPDRLGAGGAARVLLPGLQLHDAPAGQPQRQHLPG